MDTWATFWGVLFVLVLAVFALLAVVVTIGGFFDVRAMFRTINDQHHEDDPREDAESSGPAP